MNQRKYKSKHESLAKHAILPLCAANPPTPLLIDINCTWAPFPAPSYGSCTISHFWEFTAFVWSFVHCTWKWISFLLDIFINLGVMIECVYSGWVLFNITWHVDNWPWLCIFHRIHIFCNVSIDPGMFSYSRFSNLNLQKFLKRNWIIGKIPQASRTAEPSLRLLHSRCCKYFKPQLLEILNSKTTQ